MSVSSVAALLEPLQRAVEFLGDDMDKSRYFLRIASDIAEASTCRVKVGAVITKDKLIVGMGYVGSVHGDWHCNELPNGCLLVDNHGVKGSGDSGQSCIRTVHAEMNAVLKTMVRGNEHDGWLTCYCTHKPCLECTKALLQIGVRDITYINDYRDDYRDLFLNSVSVNCRIYKRVL
jgi:dCMP deaminase